MEIVFEDESRQSLASQWLDSDFEDRVIDPDTELEKVIKSLKNEYYAIEHLNNPQARKMKMKIKLRIKMVEKILKDESIIC